MIIVLFHRISSILSNYISPCCLYFSSDANHPLLMLRSPFFNQVDRILPTSKADSPQSCFAVLSHKYEFADSAEALLSDLSLPNGTTMSPVGIAPLACVAQAFAFDTVGDTGGEVDDVELMGDRGRNVDFCWLAEAMLGRYVEVGMARLCDRWRGD